MVLGWILFVAAEGRGATPASAAGGENQAPGTKRMAAVLEETHRKSQPMANRFLVSEQAEILGAQLRSRPELSRDPGFRFRYADALLNCNRNQEALAEYEAVERLATEAGKLRESGNDLNLLLNMALAWMRQGEILNCLSNHNADSCLAPIRGGGVHVVAEPSRKAIELLSRALAQYPEDLAARWLLNVAFMTVGEYPDKVPPRWLIPEKAFASEGPFPRFREVAPSVGLAMNELSGASVVEDFDGDERLDVFETSIGLRDPARLFLSRGDGTFVERTREAGLTGIVGGLNAIAADYDNDGRTDILVLRGAWMRSEGRLPKSLLRNLGNGRFEDVTEAAGLMDSFRPTQTAVWFDFDGDGWLDLFVGHESVPPQERFPCQLFHNERNGTFREMGAASGVAGMGYVKGVVAGDYDNDGRPDLYLSVLGGRNRLYRNGGPKDVAVGAAGGWVFTDVASKAGVGDPVHSFPTWFFDYDNDGWEDIFVAGYKIRNVADIAADYLGLPNQGTRAKLFRNRGDGTYEDATVRLGLDRVLHAMGCNFGDLDNDGWLDFYLGTGDPDLLTLIPNRAFRNAEGKRFLDVTTAAGVGHLQKGHGVSLADLDNDGDIDIHEDMGGAFTGDVYPNVLFENPGSGHHWLKLRLEGVRANRSAIGARVRVVVEEGNVRRTLHRSVGTGASFGGNPLRLEIGLGRASRVVEVQVDWPGSGTRQTLTGIEMDAMYRIREGEPVAKPVKLERFRFREGDPICDPGNSVMRISR